MAFSQRDVLEVGTNPETALKPLDRGTPMGFIYTLPADEEKAPCNALISHGRPLECWEPERTKESIPLVTLWFY